MIYPEVSKMRVFLAQKRAVISKREKLHKQMKY